MLVKAVVLSEIDLLKVPTFHDCVFEKNKTLSPT